MTRRRLNDSSGLRLHGWVGAGLTVALDVTPGNRSGRPPGVPKADVSNMEAIHTHSEHLKTYSYFTIKQMVDGDGTPLV